jgi:hypothetical protein
VSVLPNETKALNLLCFNSAYLKTWVLPDDKPVELVLLILIGANVRVSAETHGVIIGTLISLIRTLKF